ncbi:hypothetical protein WJX82_006897 [Trebouxia sp. C0006]
MDGLPAAFADMSDAILLVDDARLPVHKAILAANSAVFAELFMTASAQQSLSLLEVPLPGNRMWDVYTALKYLYRGCTPCASSSPEIKSTDDAKALVLFAHQYAIKSLLNACEEFLSKGLQYNLNGTNQGITMFAPVNDAFSEPLLAGISGLDNAQTILDLTGQIPDIISDLLGYSVVPQQLQENQLLAGDTFNTTNVIKTGSGVNGVPAYIPIGIKTTTDMTQVLGVGSIATILFIYRSKGDQAKYKGSQRERILSEVKPRTVTQCSSTAAPDHHAAIAILMQWKREML